MATPTIEEFLEAIYVMETENSPVISARLAERIGVSAPTMTDTLKRMVNQGLVSAGGRKDIALTEKGREIAEAVVRRHRLSERWLTDVLGLDWAKAHEEACKLEHAISPEVEERLSRLLDNPVTCPHGNPIPGSDYKVVDGCIPLNEACEGVTVEVVRVAHAAEEDQRLLGFLQRNGIIPGEELAIDEVAPWAGTMRVIAGEQSVTIGLQAAVHIWVKIKQ